MTPEEKRKADSIVDKAVAQYKEEQLRNAVNSMPVNKRDAVNEQLNRIESEKIASENATVAKQLGMMTNTEANDYVEEKVKEKVIEDTLRRLGYKPDHDTEYWRDHGGTYVDPKTGKVVE